jgi:hypothetical protein
MPYNKIDGCINPDDFIIRHLQYSQNKKTKKNIYFFADIKNVAIFAPPL